VNFLDILFKLTLLLGCYLPIMAILLWFNMDNVVISLIIYSPVMMIGVMAYIYFMIEAFKEVLK